MNEYFLIIRFSKTVKDCISYHCVVRNREVAEQIVQYLNNTQPLDYYTVYERVPEYNSLSEYSFYEE